MSEEVEMYAIWVIGADYDGPAAIFRDPQEATEWGTENHFGNWLRLPCGIPKLKP